MSPGLVYKRMASAEEACRGLAAEGASARVLAGGTDLLVALRSGSLPARTVLLDIGRVPGLGGIGEENDRLVVGALATFAEIADSALVRAFAPPLAEAAGSMGNAQVRNRATLGGNIMNASPCADSVPALIALEARLHLVSAETERWLSVEEVIDGPYSRAVGAEFLLTEVVVPKLPERARTGYVRLARRGAAAKARMAVAVVLVRDADGRLVDVRIGCGSVTPRPRRMARAERVLVGTVPGEDLVQAGAAEVAAEMISETGVRWSTEYKEPVVRALTTRALGEALGWESGAQRREGR